MYLKSVEGKILYEGRFATLKTGVEMAVNDNVCLNHINLRQANLAGANLDNAQMDYACLWGANLNSTNLTAANLANADFRSANLLDTCLAESDCDHANYDGAYFSRTIMRDAILSNTQFSCPSIFTINLNESKTLKGAIYSHLGEVDCDLSHAPLIIQGLQKPMIFMDDCALMGTEMQKIALRAEIENVILQEIRKVNIV